MIVRSAAKLRPSEGDISFGARLDRAMPKLMKF